MENGKVLDANPHFDESFFVREQKSHFIAKGIVG